MRASTVLRPMAVLLGLGAACAACCMLPGTALLASAVALGAAGLGFGLVGWIGALGAVAMVALVAAIAWRRGKTTGCTAPQASCGCGAAADPKQAELPIACTLALPERQLQAERIRSLARNGLRAARREPLKLHLTYALSAVDEVRDVVRMERSCCAFLDFDLRERRDGVHLTITAPERARDAAQMLFDHYAPAKESSQVA
jgi:hypothetical protein